MSARGTPGSNSSQSKMPNASGTLDLGNACRGDLGRCLVVLVAAQRLRHRSHVEYVRMLRRERRLALFERFGRLHDPPPRGDDPQVARAQMLARAITDLAHALLDGEVLLAHSGNPGERP